MLTIYTHQINNRVTYTFNLIFRHILNVDFKITSDADFFRQSTGAKVSYTWKPIGDELFFSSGELLFETGINSSPLFPLTKKEAETGHTEDIFAMSFFLASRYEEYQPFTADKYGRFPATQSWSYRNNFLHKPLVNIWAKKIQGILSARYPDIIFPQKKYVHIPTIDVDNAYAFLGKSPARTVGGYAKALAKFDSDDFSKRKNVLSGKEKDPYDTYDLQAELYAKYALKPIYFFLLGDWAPYDKNLPHSNSKMQALIKDICKKEETGIHPSFASNKNPEKIKTEKERLERIKKSPITKSRQHFLMLRFPDTYQHLLTSGITDDYTMGFADQVGFRAGLCTPFKFYDLKKEQETELTIHPFAVMDGTLNSYLKLSPDQALEKTIGIIKEIKNVNGEFISIWHNETLSDWREWKGWRKLYQQVLHAADPATTPLG